MVKAVDKIEMEKNNVVDKIPTTIKALNIESKLNVVEKVTTMKIIPNEELKEIRHEPPQPIEPVEEAEIKNIPQKEEPPPKAAVSETPVEEKKAEEKNLPETLLKPGDLADEKATNYSKNDEVDIEAIKKEDKEVEQQEKEEMKNEDTNQALIDSIRKQNEAQKEIVEQHKKLNEEKVKAMKEIETIAREAIEKISGGKDDAKIVADLAKHINENVNLNLENKREEEERISEKKLDVEAKKDETENKVIEESKNKDEKKKFVVEPDSLQNYSSEKQHETKNVVQTNNKEDIDVKKDKKMLPKDTGHINKVQDAPPLAVQPNFVQENNQERSVHAQDQINESSNKIVKENVKLPDNLDKLDIPKQSNTYNNTAPLFLALGKSDVKKDENKIQKIVPLPLVVSGNLMNKSENLSEGSKKVLERKEEKDVELDEKEELRAMRRDILSVKQKR